MALLTNQQYEIIFLSQHPLGLKLGHKFVPKAVKYSTSTIQIDGNSQPISTIQIELVAHVQRLQNRVNKLSRLTNSRHSLHVETSPLKINERTMRRRGSKIQSTFVEDITHRKSSNESFQMGARSQSYGLEPSDLLRQDNHSLKLRQRIALELTWKEKARANCQPSNQSQCLALLLK